MTRSSGTPPEPGTGLEEEGSQAAERERKADERDRRADERDRRAGEREREAGEREGQLYRLAAELDVLATGQRRDVLEALDRSKTVMAAVADHIMNIRHAVQEMAEHAERQAVAGKAADAAREGIREPPDVGIQRERARALRKQLSAASANLADIEERAARLHDGLAGAHPAHAAAYERNAALARQIARRAREIASHLAE